MEPPSARSSEAPLLTGRYAPATVWSPYFCTSGESCALGDVNGDGRDDIIAFHHQASATVWVGLSNGSSFGAPQEWSTSFCQSFETCAVGDVNGDGLVDLVAYQGPDHDVSVALSNGVNGFTAAQRWSNFFCLPNEVCRVADMNGDGKADLVTFTHATQAVPTVWVALSTGSSFLPTQQWSSFFCQANETCLVGDVNGDHRADTIALSPAAGNDRIWVSLSTGSGLTAPTIWGGTSGACTVGDVCTTYDVDQDGFADIVDFVHTPASPTVNVAFSNGSSFPIQDIFSGTSFTQVDSSFCQSFETCMMGKVDGTFGDLVAASGDQGSDHVWVATVSAAPITITYHQVGACNGYLTNNGGAVSVGPNAAYVIFAIDTVDNSQNPRSWAFDPSRLFVSQGGRQEPFDSSLALYNDVLGPFQVRPTSVPGGTDDAFGLSFGALVVQTAIADGAVEADQTDYFLLYNRRPTDPPIALVKSNATQTSFPLTENCRDITLR
jgi:hypothetical protein